MTDSGLRVIRRSAVAIAAVGLALGALSGCVSAQAVPTVDFPSASNSAGAQVVGQVPLSPAPSYTGYAPPLNAISVQFSGLSAPTTLRYPMTPLTFTVTLKNTSSFAFVGLDPQLVFGQCTCSPANYHIAPSTVLQLWDTATRTWKGIQSSEQNSKGDYKYASQVGIINLGPKATVTYKYRFQLSRTTGKATGLVNGTGSLDMFVLQMPKHTRVSVGLGPEATTPLTYVFG
jgi:hypothetical protein